MTTILISIDDDVLRMVNTWSKPIEERDDGKFVVGGMYDLTVDNHELQERLMLSVANGVRVQTKTTTQWLVRDEQD